MPAPDADTHVFEHQPLLGTVVEVRVGADDARLAAAVDDAVLNEVVRLQAVFSAFDPDSELCRWRRGESFVPSVEFNDLMGIVLEWQVRSHGRFNPLAALLSEMWRQAEQTGVVPPNEALAETAEAIRLPRFEMVEGLAVSVGDCASINLNAIAKGYIVDRALHAVKDQGQAWICVNAGGDLAHVGAGSSRVGIENPHRPYDNEPPLAVVDLSNAALATSGDARRGFRVAGEWFGHVLDPRTGQPIDDITSISVVAASALTADVVATVAGVMQPGAAVDYLAQAQAEGVIGGLVIDRYRQQWPTQWWADLVVTGS